MNDNAVTLSRSYTLLSVKRFLYPLLAHPRFAQTAKYIVYTSLVINFAWYIYDDYNAFLAALPPDAPLAEILITFATTIDTIAWLGLILFFELETYAIPDEFWTKWVGRLLHAGRIACYVLIAYAAYGYTADALDNFDYTEVANVSHLCDIADDGVSLQVGSIQYLDVTPGNCEDLSDDTLFYQFDGEISIIGASKLTHVQVMGWIDIVNAFVWLFVVFLIEIEVRLQAADRFASRLLKAVRQTNTVFYLVLIGNGFIWLFTDYYLYAWDAFLWIFGFWAIELNLAEWEIDRVEELGKRA